MFLLDTDSVIYSLKGNEAVKKNIKRHLTDPIRISAVTLMELYYGAYKSQQVEKNLAKIKLWRIRLKFSISGWNPSRSLAYTKRN